MKISRDFAHNCIFGGSSSVFLPMFHHYFSSICINSSKFTESVELFWNIKKTWPSYEKETLVRRNKNMAHCHFAPVGGLCIVCRQPTNQPIDQQIAATWKVFSEIRATRRGVRWHVCPRRGPLHSLSAANNQPTSKCVRL